MHLEILAYPFIFMGLYFEVFLLLTFLSSPARERRNRPASTNTPKVAIIVPCWNEETTIGGTVASLLALDYPKDKLSIILVNDGSTDGTKAVMDSYQGNPQIQILHKENGGKHTAINAGIEMATDAEFVGCLDADSFVAPSALREIISCFDDPKVAAATPAMSVLNPKTMLEHMQNAEYIFGIAARHVLSTVNGIYVTPGPFSFYRRSVIRELGGFRHAHQAEDMEMALRLQRAGWEIDNAPRARVYTKVPRTVPKLVKQRTRWTTGFLRNVTGEYRDLIGNTKYGVLGLLVLPLGFVAILGSVALFFIALTQTVYDAIRTVGVVSGVPILYTLTPHLTLESIYLSVTFVTLISFITGGTTIAFLLIGKKVSETPGGITLGIIGYALMYSFIAPFWLMRSLSDLVTNTRRAWR
jgi:cellulose synthase/poly-beta-1,6-N-acetylglucosamine synthase-like glycosyltransferase